MRIAAEAAAHATRVAAGAAATEGRIALEQAVINQLPQLVAAAAEGLQGAHVTILNGADGLNEAVATIAAQGGAVLKSVLGSLREISGEDLEAAPAAIEA